MGFSWLTSWFQRKPLRICAECRWYTPPTSLLIPVCGHPDSRYPRDSVTGERSPKLCKLVNEGGKCRLYQRSGPAIQPTRPLPPPPPLSEEDGVILDIIQPPDEIRGDDPKDCLGRLEADLQGCDQGRGS